MISKILFFFQLLHNYTHSNALTTTSLFKRCKSDNLPSEILLYQNKTARYLHDPSKVSPQIYCPQNDVLECPDYVQCFTHQSTTKSWNCNSSNISSTQFQIDILKVHLEGWERPEQTEFVNLDSLWIELKVSPIPLPLIDFPSSRQTCIKNEPRVILVAWIAAWAVVWLTYPKFVSTPIATTDEVELVETQTPTRRVSARLQQLKNDPSKT